MWPRRLMIWVNKLVDFFELPFEAFDLLILLLDLRIEFGLERRLL